VSSTELDYSLLQSYNITDGNLDADYPLRSGDTNKKISVCGWFKLATIDNPGNHYIYTQWNTTNDKRVVEIEIIDGEVRLMAGISPGTASQQLYEGTTLVTGRWYHFGFTIDGISEFWQLVVWDDTGSTKVIDTSGSLLDTLNVEDSGVWIGAHEATGSYWFDGKLDEIVVFKKILQKSEIDDIRQGVYDCDWVTSPTPPTLAPTTAAPTTAAPTTT
jgi:hypothetical protein